MVDSNSEEKIRKLFETKRSLEAEVQMLEAKFRNKSSDMSEKRRERMEQIRETLSCIDSMLVLLSEDEAFVVKRHLIDGIDWPRIAVEYKDKWGTDFTKTERTLKSYQKRALKKITQFAERQIDFPLI